MGNNSKCHYLSISTFDMFYKMVRVLKPLEDITAKVDIVFDTVLELKDPNIKISSGFW